MTWSDWGDWLREMWTERGFWGRVEIVVVLTGCGVAVGCLGIALVLLWRLLL